MRINRFPGLGIGLISAIFIFFLFLIPSLEIFELDTLDYRFRRRSPRPVSPAIFLVGIDDSSIKNIGHWPWPRSYHAQIIEILQEAGASVIGYDVLFSEKTDPAEDQAIKKALFRRKNVHLPFYFKRLEEGSRGILQGSQQVLPIPELTSSSAGVWSINAPTDEDGVIRRIPLVIESEGKLSPTFGLALTLSYLNLSPEKIKLIPGDLEISGEGGKRLIIPIDRQGQMLVNFAGDFQTFASQSCRWETVLNSYLKGKKGLKPIIPLSRFKDKIVLIGSSASGIGDLRPTPVNPLFPMFALHANIINNILEQDFLIRPNLWLRFFLLVLIGLIIGGVVGRERLVRGLLFSLLFLGIYISLAFFLFNHNIWVDIISPTSVIFLSCLSGTLFHFVKERREKSFVRSTFQRYVAPEIVSELLSKSETINLGGARRRITVLFADIRGFTRISESLPPEEVVQLLNESLSVIVDAIFRYKGTLDKFIGDCVMAVFGAPLFQEDQELMAVKASLKIREKMVEVSKRWSSKVGVKIEIGIGINSGEAIIGNIGTLKRMDYTAIGDTVNLAERLEEKAKPGQILISENSCQPISGKIISQPQPPAIIKGKSKPIVVYEVIGLKESRSCTG